MKIYPSLCRSGIAVIHQIPFHVCKELTLIHILENDLCFTTVAGSQVLQAGQTEILNVKEPVEMSAVEESSPCRVLYYSFAKEYLETIDYNFENVTYNCNICNFFGVAAPQVYIDALTRKLLELATAMAANTGEIRVRQKTDELLAYVRNHFDDVAHIFTRRNGLEASKERFQRISEYMISHVSEKMSLGDIAASEYLSSPYLSREFASKLERNYNDVLNYYRTINAVIQLLDTDDTLTFIAERSGFSSVRYYHKVFSDFLGCLPSKFRSMYKGRVARVKEEPLDASLLWQLSGKESESVSITLSFASDEQFAEIAIENDQPWRRDYLFFMKDAADWRKLIVVDCEDESVRQARNIMGNMKAGTAKLPELRAKRDYVFLSEKEDTYRIALEEREQAKIKVVLYRI